MNKKHTIMAGILAGGLLLSTNTANASMITGDSPTTPGAKTSVAYKWNTPMQHFYNNQGGSIADKLVNMLPIIVKSVVINNKPVVEKPVNTGNEPTPVEEKPVVPEKEPVAETPVVNDKEPVVEAPATPEKEEVKVSSAVQQVIDLTNQERAKAGLKALQVDVKLTQSAQAKSQDMKNNNYFSHTSPTYGSPFDEMTSLGITYKSAGENIAMGQRTATEVVNGWMNSPGHRENIMNPSYTHIGVGLSDSGFYWTQQFIGK